MNKTEIILENYRAAYDKANGKGVVLQAGGYGWVYIAEQPYRLKALVNMTAVLNERAGTKKV